MPFQIDRASSEKTRELLLVLPVPFLKKNQDIFMEMQACNGLECWADNFDSILVAAPTISESIAQNYTSFVWIDTATFKNPERFEFVGLPWSYSLVKFLFDYPSVRSQLADLIKRCHYLQFAIGGLWGDWAAIAALEAHRQKRAFAIHTDRVEHKVMLETSHEPSFPERTKNQIVSFLMAQYHQRIIQNCTLGLWHGQDCYAAYSPFCRNSFLIHNIHLKHSEQIEREALTAKIENSLSEPILRICYAGRMEPMKAPLDWIKAIAKAKELGVNLKAVWLGDGSLFQQMQSLSVELNLRDCVELAGFESNKKKVLDTIQNSHLMVFTHITPESPRCLIEALICGTPIVGYRSPYAEDLLKNYGGGQLVPIKNWEELSMALLELFKNRQVLARYIEEAAINGQRFNDKAVFKERSDLMKKYLK